MKNLLLISTTCILQVIFLLTPVKSEDCANPQATDWGCCLQSCDSVLSDALGKMEPWCEKMRAATDKEAFKAEFLDCFEREYQHEGDETIGEASPHERVTEMKNCMEKWSANFPSSGKNCWNKQAGMKAGVKCFQEKCVEKQESKDNK